MNKKKEFLEKVSGEGDIPVFTLKEKEEDILEEVLELGWVEVDGERGVVELTELGEITLNMSTGKQRSGGISIYPGRYNQEKLVEKKREAEEALELLNNGSSSHSGSVQSQVEEVASLCFAFAENDDSIKESIKLFETVKNLSLLSQKMREQE